MKDFFKNILGWLLSICIAFVIVFLLKTFIGMPTTVKGTSMAPTFLPEEKLLLGTWSTNFDKVPNRGDVVTFEAPSTDLIRHADLSNPVANYDRDEKSLYEKILYYGLGITKTSYIKRVIGRPGDHVEIKNNHVYINGKILDEPYISDALRTDMSLGGEFSDIIVPEGYIYVLGDNRSSSADSRRFGCIPISKIEGTVAFRWWPLNKFGTI